MKLSNPPWKPSLPITRMFGERNTFFFLSGFQPRKEIVCTHILYMVAICYDNKGMLLCCVLRCMFFLKNGLNILMPFYVCKQLWGLTNKQINSHTLCSFIVPNWVPNTHTHPAVSCRWIAHSDTWTVGKERTMGKAMSHPKGIPESTLVAIKVFPFLFCTSTLQRCFKIFFHR